VAISGNKTRKQPCGAVTTRCGAVQHRRRFERKFLRLDTPGRCVPKNDAGHTPESVAAAGQVSGAVLGAGDTPRRSCLKLARNTAGLAACGTLWHGSIGLRNRRLVVRTHRGVLQFSAEKPGDLGSANGVFASGSGQLLGAVLGAGC
jgi:hypothetical protein